MFPDLTASSFVTGYMKTELALSYRCEKFPLSSPPLEGRTFLAQFFSGPEYERTVLMFLLKASLIDHLKVSVGSLRFLLL